MNKPQRKFDHKPSNRKKSGHKRKGIKSGSNNARWYAFRALQAYHDRNVFVSRVLDDQFQAKTIPSVDRKMATELANETVRRLETIDLILGEFVTRPRDNVEVDLWTILQIGCLQLVFLPRVASHAAVHETVQLCEEIGKGQAKAFVNGVLRGLGRAIVKRTERDQIVLADLDRKTLPLVNLDGPDLKYSCVEFDRELFADPSREPLEAISQVTSLPMWLLQRLCPDGENFQWMLETGLWMTNPGRMSLRVNLLNTDREKVLEVLQAAEISAKPGALPEAIQLEQSVSIIDLPGYREGWFSVQDSSAMSAIDLLDPQPCETVLDLCAAPGGKATHLAERMKNDGRVIACESATNRIRTINENAGRLGLSCIETYVISDDGRDIPTGPFDAAIVDVPCSNTGVLGKRPEARWRLMPMSFRELIPLQMRLLKDAMSRVRPGGRVLYSTCSIDFEENRGVVDAVLASQQDFSLKEERVHHPGQPGDGGYQALLIRS